MIGCIFHARTFVPESSHTVLRIVIFSLSVYAGVESFGAIREASFCSAKQTAWPVLTSPLLKKRLHKMQIGFRMFCVLPIWADRMAFSMSNVQYVLIFVHLHQIHLGI